MQHLCNLIENVDVLLAGPQKEDLAIRLLNYKFPGDFDGLEEKRARKVIKYLCDIGVVKKISAT
jgi:hypothetical protein